MIQIARTRDRLRITLPATATIATVEEDAEKVRLELAKMKKIADVHIDCGAVEEMDTAYLQLVIAILGIEHLGRAVNGSVSDPARLGRILELFGLSGQEPFAAGAEGGA